MVVGCVLPHTRLARASNKRKSALTSISASRNDYGLRFQWNELQSNALMACETNPNPSAQPLTSFISTKRNLSCFQWKFHKLGHCIIDNFSLCARLFRCLPQAFLLEH